MRVVIDARPLSHPQAGGFRTFTRTLLQGLAERNDPAVELLLYVDRPLSSAHVLPAGSTVRVLSPNRLKTDWLLFGQQVRRDKPDVVHGTMNYVPPRLPCPTTVTIHDAMGIKAYPFARAPRTPRHLAMDRYWKQLTLVSARAARRIVTVSHFSARELAGTLNQPIERFDVVYNGVALPAPQTRAPREAGSVLAIASSDRRKNLDCLCRALGEERGGFADAVPRLDIVCTSGGAAAWAEAAMKQHAITNFRLLRGLDDQALSDAFATSTVFAFPSRMEGFGLPPLEAMSTGCPVVSSCAPCLPEVLGDAPLFFDPDRPDQLAHLLDMLLRDPTQRRARGAEGKAHAARYTSRAMADAMVAVWRRAAAA